METVNLSKVENDKTQTYSGGMKRRLSILLSSIGQPKVIFLDEPTTGLDPVNRRGVWKMIQKLKNELSIILTTHSMEEADYLSDRIGIIKSGVIQCIGTPNQLKSLFGNGYLINCEYTDNNKNTAKELLLKYMPHCVVNDIVNKSNVLSVNLPFEFANEMKFVVNIMNNNYEGDAGFAKDIIVGVSISVTSIEDIFLKINGDINDVGDKLFDDRDSFQGNSNHEPLISDK